MLAMVLESKKLLTQKCFIPWYTNLTDIVSVMEMTSLIRKISIGAAALTFEPTSLWPQ